VLLLKDILSPLLESVIRIYSMALPLYLLPDSTKNVTKVSCHMFVVTIISNAQVFEWYKDFWVVEEVCMMI
jgi:hypothetical protein